MTIEEGATTLRRASNGWSCSRLVAVLQRHRRPLRFAVVGVTNTLVDLALFLVFYLVFGWHLLAANSLAYAAAVVNSYLLNKAWTFEGRARAGGGPSRFLLFLAFNLAGLLMANMVIWVAAHAVPVVVAKLLATGIVMVWTYITNARFVYAGPQKG